jgi:polyketide synthase 12
MAPQTFLKRPWLWLKAISDFRATTSGAPNFAFEHVLRTLTPERMDGVKLDSWRLAFNGAEPIQSETLERFSAALAPYGFRSEALYPCYGLAEATLFVTGGWAASRGFARECSREHLARAQARQVHGASNLRVVRCGRTARGLTLRIVRDGRQCACDEIGEVWLAGASVAMGYWNKPNETRQAFENRLEGDGLRYLRTGDLGFVDEHGELFITGRSKDLMIVEGKNHYPHDIEHTVQSCDDWLRNRAGAAFSIPIAGNERVVVVQEVKVRGDAQRQRELTSSIRRAVRDEHGLGLHEVLLLGQGQVPRTTSGKIRRAEAKQMFLAGLFAQA